MRMQPSISVIVPTRNRAALLARLLESFRHLRYPYWSLIVVDDGSTDDTAAVVDRFAAQGLPVSYAYQPWRKMGAARNLGIGLAASDVVAFTDDDSVADASWLSALARAFDANPH